MVEETTETTSNAKQGIRWARKALGWLFPLLLGSVLGSAASTAVGLDDYIKEMRAKDAVVDGYWTGSYFEDGQEMGVALYLLGKDRRIDGDMVEKCKSCPKPEPKKAKLTGKVKGRNVDLEKKPLKGDKAAAVATFSGECVDGVIKGRWSSPTNSGPFLLRRDELVKTATN